MRFEGICKKLITMHQMMKTRHLRKYLKINKLMHNEIGNQNYHFGVNLAL